jgi:hypothetical protein
MCPHCNKRIRFKAKYAGKQVKCPSCAGPLTLTAITDFPSLESDQPDRLSPIAGWVTSVVLHGLLLLSFTGITWYSGFGTGAGQRDVGIVAESGDYIEAGGGGLSPIQAAAPELAAPPLSTQADNQPIESLGSSVAPSGENVAIEIGTLDGGIAEPVKGDWGDFGASEGTAGGGGASFFGLEARGGKFVYVVDRSGSMESEGRLQAARNELYRSVYALQRTMEFFIVFYESDFEPMPADGLVKATGPNQKRYCDWAKRIDSRGGTDPEGAMLKALSLKPDAVWLLSDGRFDAEVCDVIRANNPGAQVQIHTIAFYDEQGRAVLQRIAEENRGRYRFVAPPAGRPSYLRPRMRR